MGGPTQRSTEEETTAHWLVEADERRAVAEVNPESLYSNVLSFFELKLTFCLPGGSQAYE